MILKTFASLAALGLALAAASATPATARSEPAATPNQLSDPSSAFKDTGRRSTWHGEVARTERGHMIGDPDADTSLIEFISYTCGHCATFAREGEGALDLALLAPGHLNLEVRPVIRNAIDLTVSLLAQCGPEDRFKDRHRMFLMRQDAWLEKARQAPQSQQAIWQRGDAASRLNAAQALDLDDMLAARGVSKVDINKCLADDKAALALISGGRADREEFAVPGTPSFALDGELLEGVHDWPALYEVLSERFRPGAGG
ncbi:thioredoxin domain-containing protein [Erythrobacter sp.]|jgi:protein-disulfide isomerase|uniref:thioredoxin domain-containing protein n=1 Tax=Erythrobacter sp. TaxID=1042 RepID=UPI002EB36D9E|nr:thioredoxin domain-containing protein [Erythrobacter sp.]